MVLPPILAFILFGGGENYCDEWVFAMNGRNLIRRLQELSTEATSAVLAIPFGDGNLVNSPLNHFTPQTP